MFFCQKNWLQPKRPKLFGQRLPYSFSLTRQVEQAHISVCVCEWVWVLEREREIITTAMVTYTVHHLGIQIHSCLGLWRWLLYQDLFSWWTVIVEEDWLNSMTCSPEAFILHIFYSMIQFYHASKDPQSLYWNWLIFLQIILKKVFLISSRHFAESLRSKSIHNQRS